MKLLDAAPSNGAVLAFLSALYSVLGLLLFAARSSGLASLGGLELGTGATPITAALLVAILTLGRYAIIARFAATLASNRRGASLLAAGAWILALSLLVLVLLLLGRRAPVALPLAALSACVGPLGLFVLAGALGLWSLARDRARAAGVGKVGA